MNNDKIFELFINALVLFTALPVHECAHAWVAHKMGDDTAKNQGRITLNPFKHLSLWGSIMMVLIGFGETFIIIGDIFLYITMINISLGVFNFLPIPPLDGSKIFNAVLPEKIYFKIMKYEQFIFIALIALVYSGLLDKPLGFLQGKVTDVMIFLTNWVDIIFSAVLNKV